MYMRSSETSDSLTWIKKKSGKEGRDRLRKLMLYEGQIDALEIVWNKRLHEQHDEKFWTGKAELMRNGPTVVKMLVVKVTSKRAVNVLWYVQK